MNWRTLPGEAIIELILAQIMARHGEVCFASRVPTYFFNFTGEDSRDDVGLELEDSETAFIEAVRGARSCMADSVLKGALSLNEEVEVTDEDGRILFVVRFSEAARDA